MEALAVKSKIEMLLDPNLPFTRRLQLAATVELEYWDNRMNKPNLLVHEFLKILPLIPVSTQPLWEPRKSNQGKYGLTGEKSIFKFDFRIIFLGKIQEFFIKGYFFEEGSCRGVEIQSFRRKQNLKLMQKLRLLK